MIWILRRSITIAKKRNYTSLGRNGYITFCRVCFFFGYSSGLEYSMARISKEIGQESTNGQKKKPCPRQIS